MAKIPPIRRISTEDFKEQAGWIEKLLAPINSYMEQTTSALNRGLTIGDNFAGELRDVDVDGTYPLKLSWTLAARPRAVLVGNVQRTNGAAVDLEQEIDTEDSSTSVILSIPVFVQWSFNQAGQLQIDNVVGVTPTAAAKYKLTLLILTG